MNIQNPKLWCVEKDLKPGTVRVTWDGPRGPEQLELSGNDADNLMEQYRGSQTEGDRWRLLVSLIQGSAAHVE